MWERGRTHTLTSKSRVGFPGAPGYAPVVLDNMYLRHCPRKCADVDEIALTCKSQLGQARFLKEI